MADIVAEFESIFGKITATERKWLTERIGALIIALTPFAEAARQFAPYPESMSDTPVESTFTLEQLRAAARALSAGPHGGEKS